MSGVVEIQPVAKRTMTIPALKVPISIAALRYLMKMTVSGTFDYGSSPPGHRSGASRKVQALLSAYQAA